MFLGVIVLVAILSILIHYPDTIETRLVIRSYDRAVPVFAGDSGRLARLFVRNGQLVSKDQPLALIDDTRTGDTTHWRLVLAPDSGKVSITGLIEENQQVAAGQRLFDVTAGKNKGFYGVMAIPQQEISNVQKGQKVLIKINSYPFQNYGLLHGVIDTVDESPYNDSMFLSKVSFTGAADRRILLKNGLTANSQVITRDISLAGRLLNRFREVR